MSNRDLLLFFQRSNEPVFGVKRDSDGRSVRFDVPQEILPDRYKPIINEVQNRFGDDDVDRTIPIRNVQPPNIQFAQVLDRKKPFSNFIKRHQQIAGQLAQIFLDAPDLETLKSYLAYCHGRINPGLYNYALAVALQHRQDTQDLPLPSIVEQSPNLFIDPGVIPEAREESQFVPQGVRVS